MPVSARRRLHPNCLAIAKARRGSRLGLCNRVPHGLPSPEFFLVSFLQWIKPKQPPKCFKQRMPSLTRRLFRQRGDRPVQELVLQQPKGSLDFGRGRRRLTCR